MKKTTNNKKLIVYFILFIILSVVFLLVGRNNLVGWVIFILTFSALYLQKSILSKKSNVILLYSITILILCISFAVTRPLPSIRGLLLATSEMTDAKRKGNLTQNSNAKDINSIIAELRKDSQNNAKNYKVPEDIETNKFLVSSTKCEWVTVKNAPTDKVVIYLHGGAYVTGDLDTSRPFAVRLSKNTGYKVLVVEYALAPEYPFPTAFNQVLEVYHWIINQGVPPSNIAIVGDSAGGGLEVATVLALKVNKEALPGALVLISPWLDLTTDPAIHGLKPHQGEFDWYNQTAKA